VLAAPARELAQVPELALALAQLQAQQPAGSLQARSRPA